MSAVEKLAREILDTRRLALGHATAPQLGNASLDGGRIDFRDWDGNLVGGIGIGEDGGIVVDYDYGPKPGSPSRPTVTADSGMFRVEWDGTFVPDNGDGSQDGQGLAPTSDLDRVEVHASMDENFVPDRVQSFAGAFSSLDGGSFVFGPLPEAGTYYFRLVARSKAGKFSAPSERVEQELAIASMDLAVTDAWLTGEAAQTTADGKNSIWRGPDEPVEDPEKPFRDGDIWFEMTPDGKSIPNIWDEATGSWVGNDDYRQSEIERVQQELRQDLDAVITDGSGTKNFFRPTAPTAGESSEGDLWFDSSAEGKNTPHVYENGEWVSAADQRVDAIEQAQADMAGDITQAEADAIAEAGRLADAAEAAAVAAAEADASSKASAARSEAIEAAASDAQEKADAAKAAAEAAAKTYADTVASDASDDAIAAAKADATAKADAAKSAAIASAKATATSLADQAKSDAIDHTDSKVFDSTQIADDAITTPKLATDAVVARAIKAGSIGTVALAADAVTAEKVRAGAIGAQAIAAESIEGEHVKAGSLTADKLLVGGPRNLLPNGALEKGDATGWPDDLAYTTDAPDGYAGSVFADVNRTTTRNMIFGHVPVTPGNTLVFETWLKADKPGSRMYFEIRDQDAVMIADSDHRWTSVEGDGPAGSYLYPVANYEVPTEWTRLVQTVDIRPGVKTVYFGRVYFNHSNGSERDAIQQIAGTRMYEQVGTTLIQGGAVTAEKIAVGAITAESGIIGSIDAGTITVGEMSGARIKAGTIDADRVLVEGSIGSTLIENGAVTTEKIKVGAITAESGIIGSIDANVITVGKIMGNQLDADAINGKTITGATIRTASSGSRVELTQNGLKQYNSLGATIVDMTSGSFALEGGTITGAEVRTSASGARVEMDSMGLHLFDKDSRRTFYANATDGSVTMIGDIRTASLGARVEIVKSQNMWGTTGSGIRFYTENDETDGALNISTEKAPFSGSISTVEAFGSWLSMNSFGTASLWGGSRATINVDDGNAKVIADGDELTLEGGGGALSLSETSNGPRVQSVTVWDVNSSSGDPVRVNAQGTLFKSSSSRRYKADIQPASDCVEVLEVEPKTWLDKEDLSTFEAEREFREEVPIGPPPQGKASVSPEPERVYGAVAEEIHDLGLTQLVSYDAYGRPDGLHYEKFGIALIPIVRELRDRIDSLEAQLATA